MEMKTSAVSFAFKAKSDTGPLKTKSAIDERKEDVEATDYVTSVDGTDIKSVNERVTQSGLLVIPLIQKNNWRVNSGSASSKKELSSDTKVVGDASASAEDNIAKRAAKELIEAARKREDEEVEETHSDMAIPLLMQNKIPAGYETDEKVDTELRPTESTLDDYEQVPIEHFGLALLRGMGWKEGEGVGKNKKNVKPIEAQLRPKGMGLGADKSRLLQDKNKSNKKHRLKPGDEKVEEVLEMKQGVQCVITKGAHLDLYATIQAVDDDNCRCVVKLSLSQETVDISQFSVRLIDKQEFEKYSKYLNKGTSDRYKEKHSNGDDSPSKKKRRTERDDREKQSDTSKHKHSSKHAHSDPPVNKQWVQPLLKVKVIDRKYKDGRYYASKVVVYDILPDSVVCKTDSGRLLEGLTEDQLESVIPRADNAHVMIVAGEYRKEVGEMVQRDREKERVTIQLLSDRANLVTLRYDDVCEYTGDVQHLLDY